MAAGLAGALLVAGLAVVRHGDEPPTLPPLVVSGSRGTPVAIRAGRYDGAAARLDLGNPGPDAVVVLDGAADGWRVQVDRGPLLPGSQTTLRLVAPLDCRALPRPTSLTVQLRGPDGRRLTQRLPLRPQDLLDEAADDCGQLPIEGALDNGHTSAVVVDGVLELDLDVLDRSAHGLRLLSASADGARVVVRPALPLLLPARVPGAVATPRTLHLQVRVVSCRDALGGFFGPGLTALHLEAEPVGGTSGPQLVTVDVSPSADFRGLLAGLVEQACGRR